MVRFPGEQHIEPRDAQARNGECGFSDGRDLVRPEIVGGVDGVAAGGDVGCGPQADMLAGVRN